MAFMTLEEFLLIDDDTCKVLSLQGSTWVEWYHTAKTSFEKHGPTLPVGTRVMDLGIGTVGGGSIKRVSTTMGEYTVLIDEKTEKTSYIRTEFWWRVVKPLDSE